MEYLPKGDPDIQQSDARYGSADPSRRDHSLQRMYPGFAGGVEQEIVVSPVAQAESALRNPRQQRKHQTNFQAENDIEDDT